MIRTFFFRLWATLHAKQREARLREELEQHLEQLTDAHCSRGQGLEQARLSARRDFGPVEALKEHYRDQARFRWLENIWRDARFALRQMHKSPAFTAAAILSLALGIGANAALFSFVNELLLKRLPVRGPERLAILQSSGNPLSMAYGQLNELNRHASELEGLLGRFPLDVSASTGDEPQWISAELVSGDYARVLQLRAERGRLLNQSDLDSAAGNPVCVISERFWRGRFAAAEDVVGRRILLNMRSYRIVGVMERGFRGLDLQRPSDLLIPATRLPDYLPAFAKDPRFDWTSRLYLFSCMGRLRAHATRTSAGQQLTALNRSYSKTVKRESSPDMQLSDGSAGFRSLSELGTPASILLAVSLVVLIMACANLATLLLSRTSARTSEFALRLAIGGSRARIFTQVLVESSLLAAAGTALAFFIAHAVQHTLLSFLNRTAPTIHQLRVTMDSRVLGFVALTATISVLFFGTAPAWQAARTGVLGSSAGNSPRGARLRRSLVAAQIALSFVVILAAGLLAGTLRHLQTLELGYQPDEIAALDIRPAAGGYTGLRADQFYSRAVEKLRSVPGVKTASSALSITFDAGMKMKLDGSPAQAPRETNVFVVNPGYFETFGARVLNGRDFNKTDTSDKPQVYIISQHLAQTYFHGENPVGRYLLQEGRKLPVVGVVSDIRDQGLREASLDTVYQAAGQLLTSSLTVFARCHRSCQPLLPALQSAIRDLDSNTPILSIRTMRTELEGAFSSETVLGFLSSLFAALAMMLVAAGLYGVLSYALNQRTREVGIRIALGASSGNIAALFAREAIAIVLLGTGIGVPLAPAAATLLKSQLFGVTPRDPGILLACLACVFTTVLLAALPPIRRAMRIAPQQALRLE